MTRIIMVALDGLRPDMVDPALTPHLAALAASGTRFANARSVFPSETRVATPSLITGCRPGGHGMVANTLFDASVAPDRLLRTKLVEDVMAMAAGAESPLQRPSWPNAWRPPRCASHWSAPAPPVPRACCIRRPSASAPSAGMSRIRRARRRTKCAPHSAPPRSRGAEHPARRIRRPRPSGTRAAAASPDVALLWLSEPDVSFHWGGLRAEHTLRALRTADAVLGRIVDWRDAQPNAQEIAIIVLSDHGHVTGRGKRCLRSELHSTRRLPRRHRYGA